MINNFAFGSFLLFLLVILIIGYLISAIRLFRKGRKWPLYRIGTWTLGIVCVGAALEGPIASRAHHDFLFHMIGHLLLGMLAPLLLVLAAPMTLLLNTLNVKVARFITRILKSWPFNVLSNPVITALLNVGGLWILYLTDLYAMMHENSMLFLFIHFHIFIAGYFFTFSIIVVDPNPHKKTFSYRAIMLIFAIAAHGILSKYIFAHPPLGVSQNQAELGSLLMYYGGDVIDLVIIFILCLEWYRGKGKKCGVNTKELNSIY